MNHTYYAVIVSILISGLYCSSNNQSKADGDGSTVFDLRSNFATVGNQVALPTTLGARIFGLVIDSDGDGNGDGLDLDGNTAEAELVYITGNLKNTTGPKVLYSLGFYFKNDFVPYYLVPDSSSLKIATDVSGTNNQARLVISESDSTIQGIDNDGNGSVDHSALAGTVVVYFSESVTALITGDNGPWQPGTTVSLQVGGSGITNYRYALNAGSYSGSLAVSVPVEIQVPVPATGGVLFTVSVIGQNSKGAWQPESRPTNFTAAYGYHFTVNVSNAGQMNSNKLNPAAAVELWAATTLYETASFANEKVMLQPDGSGGHNAHLFVNDSSIRNVILFDDVVTRVHVIDNPPTFDSLLGAQGYATVETDNFFSPCYSGYLNTGETLQDLFVYTETYVTAPPFVPRFLSPIFTTTGPGTSTNDEVFFVASGVTPGGTISADYVADFNKGSHALFCGCSKPTDLPMQASTGGSAVLSGVVFNLTDTNFSATAGNCADRIY